MASKSVFLVPRLALQARPSSLRATQTFRLRQRLPLLPVAFNRCAHSIPRPPPAQPSNGTASPTAASDASGNASESSSQSGPTRDAAYYQLSFTCVPCGERSTHKISKQGYHRGAVLISCPGCRNRHVISDHLGIFGDEKVTIEDIMRRKGQLVKRGSLGEDGDIEFWADEQYAEQQQD